MAREMEMNCPRCAGTGKLPGSGRLAVLVKRTEKSGVSKTEMARSLHLSRSYFNDIVSGKRGLTPLIADRWMGVLDGLAKEENLDGQG